MNKKLSRRAFAALLLPVGALADDGFAVIVKASEARALSRTQIRRILLGEQTLWPGGGKITLYIGPSGESSRVACLKRIAGMSESEFYKNIMQLNFTGKGELAPITVSSTLAVIENVMTKPGAVGVIPAAQVSAAVRKLEI